MREFGSLYKAYDAGRLRTEACVPERSVEPTCTEQNVEHHVAEVVTLRCVEAGRATMSSYEKHTSTFCVDKWLETEHLPIRSPWLIGGHLPYWVARWPGPLPVDFLVCPAALSGQAQSCSTSTSSREEVWCLEHSPLSAATDSTHFGMYQRPDLRSLLVIRRERSFRNNAS